MLVESFFFRSRLLALGQPARVRARLRFTCVYFFEKSFFLQLTDQAVVIKLFGFGFSCFGASRSSFVYDEFEHLRIQIWDSLHDVHTELPGRFDGLGIIRAKKARDRALARLFIAVKGGDSFRVTGDKILYRLPARGEELSGAPGVVLRGRVSR